jgi:hypothetical protein
MAIRRITISVPEETVARIKRAAQGVPVSAWVTDVIEEKLADDDIERQWQEMYAEVAPRPADKKRAAAIFKRLMNPRRRGA